MYIVSNHKKTFTTYIKKALVGVSYGLSFPLTLVILDFWLKDMNVSNKIVGLFSLLHLPFTCKFIWGIFIENYDVPLISKFVTRNQGWLIFSHIVLCLGIIIMAYADACDGLWCIMIGAFLVSLGDGCKNVCLYPYQISDTSKESEYGYTANAVGLGHRLGTIFIKVSMLYIADIFSWRVAYIFAGCVLLVSLLSIIWMDIPMSSRPNIRNFKEAFINSFWQPLMEFQKRSNCYRLLPVLVCYKGVDFTAQKMARVFLIEVGFSKSVIAELFHLYGAIAVIIGGFLGGYIVKKIGVRRSMIYLGIAHSLSFLLYVPLITSGACKQQLMSIIIVEGVSGGAMSVAFLALIYRVIKSSVLYGVVWALCECGMMCFMSVSGVLADFLGWRYFFLSLPLLFIPNLWWLHRIKESSVEHSS